MCSSDLLQRMQEIDLEEQTLQQARLQRILDEANDGTQAKDRKSVV